MKEKIEKLKLKHDAEKYKKRQKKTVKKEEL